MKIKTEPGIAEKIYGTTQREAIARYEGSVSDRTFSGEKQAVNPSVKPNTNSPAWDLQNTLVIRARSVRSVAYPPNTLL